MAITNVINILIIQTIFYVRNPPITIQSREIKLKENPLENNELLYSGFINLSLQIQSMKIDNEENSHN